MSYDILVFDPLRAPVATPEFLEWSRAQQESCAAVDERVLSSGLQAWYDEMRSSFAPLGIDAAEPRRHADYGATDIAIYVGFAYSDAADALAASFAAARRAGVGLLQVSAGHRHPWVPPRPDAFEVFYWMRGARDSAPSEYPVTMTIRECVSDVVARMKSPGDFAGVVDRAGTTLQFRLNKEASTAWVEVPVPSRGGSMGRVLRVAELADLLDSLSETIDPEALSGFEFQSWG